MSQSADYDPQPSKAEELFYLLKKLAGQDKILDMNVVRAATCPTISASSALYASLSKLKEKRAIELVMDITCGGRGRIVQIKLLQENISLPKGKPGRKPRLAKAENEKTREPISGAVQLLPAAFKQEPLPLPNRTDTVSKQPVCESRKLGAVVLIDENQIIASERDSGKFDPCAVLEKIRRCLQENVERVYFYCSEATERRARPAIESLIRLDNSLIRMIKTGSMKDMVDRRIREDIELWSRIDAISTIVLGTADGGPDFRKAIEQIKQAGKKFVLLKIGSTFNFVLRQSADALIDASGVGAERRPFGEIVAAAQAGTLHYKYKDENAQFLIAIVCGLVELFKNKSRGVQFSEVIEYIRPLVRKHREFDGFGEQDIREGLTTLVQVGRLLSWKKDESGKNIYKLLYSSTLLWVSKRHISAPNKQV